MRKFLVILGVILIVDGKCKREIDTNARRKYAARSMGSRRINGGRHAKNFGNGRENFGTDDGKRGGNLRTLRRD